MPGGGPWQCVSLAFPGTLAEPSPARREALSQHMAGLGTEDSISTATIFCVWKGSWPTGLRLGMRGRDRAQDGYLIACFTLCPCFQWLDVPTHSPPADTMAPGALLPDTSLHSFLLCPIAGSSSLCTHPGTASEPPPLLRLSAAPSASCTHPHQPKVTILTTFPPFPSLIHSTNTGCLTCARHC